jgi:hypothetical protein
VRQMPLPSHLAPFDHSNDNLHKVQSANPLTSPQMSSIQRFSFSALPTSIHLSTFLSHMMAVEGHVLFLVVTFWRPASSCSLGMSLMWAFTVSINQADAI